MGTVTFPAPAVLWHSSMIQRLANERSLGPTANADPCVIDGPAGHDSQDDRSALYGESQHRQQPSGAEDAALHGALDSSHIGVWDFDLRTGRATRSITHDQIFGYAKAREEWTFDTFLDHVAPEQRDLLRIRYNQCLTTGKAVFDCRIIRADGSPAHISSRGRLIRDAGGRPARIVGIVMDVTAHHIAEQRLALVRRRKETFVSTLAHEIRQPLAALLAAVEVVQMAPASASACRATEIMKRQIDQMNRVVEDLTDATRWASGKMSLRKQRLDVRHVIANAVADVASAVGARGLELAVAMPAEPLWANADPQRLQQVLSNLLRNAVKYTDSGGRISLTAERTAETVTLRIKDTGCGIDPEALPHVFELFSQARPSDSAGLGIGLSVAKEIVVLHGGLIAVASGGEGRGSEFIVTLLRANPPDPAP